MTRIERLPSVWEHGLLADNVCKERGIAGVEIGYEHIKARRARRPVRCGVGGTLADYVPFYFAPRSPMLYAIHCGNVSAEAARTDEIAYLVTSTQTLRQAGLTVVASNRHAELDYADLSDRDEELDDDGFVDWPLMTERYWGNTAQDPDRKERRQAECLVHPGVAWTLLEMIVVRSHEARERVLQTMDGRSDVPEVDVRPGWYF